jgi:DNA-binding transcriptional ArsR family regulator
VTDLARPFDISLNAVSKHIRVLERAQLVRCRQVGREHLMAFDPAPLNDAARWMQAQSMFWRERLQALDALLQDEDRSATRRRAKKGPKR